MAADTEKMTESMSHLSYTKYYVHAQEGYVVICRAEMRLFTVRLLSRWNISRRNLESSLEEGIVPLFG